MNVTPEANTIRILKIETCLALKGDSTLTYQIACNSESEILLRVVNNTNKGIFNKEWIKLSSIFEAFDKNPSDNPIESSLLAPLFKGKSISGITAPIPELPKCSYWQTSDSSQTY